MAYPTIAIEYYQKLALLIYWKNGKPRWKKTSKHKKQIKNTLAGTTKNTGGYRRISCTINKVLKNVSAHRLRWFMEHGTLPSNVDHGDDIKDNNRIDNLRDFNHSENSRSRYYPRGSSGFIGVVELTSNWLAVIHVNKERISIGKYDTAVDAAKARDQYIIDHGLEYCAKFNFRQGKRKVTGLGLPPISRPLLAGL